MSAEARTRDQVLALAAVVEAARLVDLLARNGTAPASEMQALADSLFRFEWQDVAEVFGGVEMLARAIRLLENLLENPADPTYRNVTRYTLALLHLGGRLARDRARLARIRARLQHTSIQSEHFASRFDEISASVAAIYQDTVSTYRYRIQVTGSAMHLQEQRVADRIRTLLLAGLRAVVLWRHLGGSRADLLLRRGRLLATCRELHRPH